MSTSTSHTISLGFFFSFIGGLALSIERFLGTSPEVSIVLTRERVNELPLGVPIPFDIVGKNGLIFIRSGSILTQEIVDRILERGLFGLNEDLPAEQGIELAKDQYYDRELIARIDANFDVAVSALSSVVDLANGHRAIAAEPLQEIADRWIEEISEDVSTVLACWHERTSIAGAGGAAKREELDLQLARSTQLATLGTAIACSMGLSEQNCRAVALAGLLHDLSLVANAPEESEMSPSESERHKILMHSLRSAEMISHSPSIPGMVRVIIMQVHEQLDGTGYPRGILGHQMNPMARILSLVDAYLTMIESHSDRASIVPSDALAYLVYQTLNGKFDRGCTQALVSMSSVYPVGSRVLLSTGETAIVVKSNEDEPANPIILTDKPPFRVFDLAHNSLKVTAPYFGDRSRKERLKTKQLSEVLWMHPLVRDPLNRLE